MNTKLNRPFVLITLIVLSCMTSSCSLYRVVPASNYSSQSIKQYEINGKYLILQRGEEAWHIYDVNNTDNGIHAKLDPQIGYHTKYLNPKINKLNDFDKRKDPEVVNSVHLYTSDQNFNSFDTLVSLPISSIDSIALYSYAQAPSRASKIVPAVFLLPALLGIVFLLQGPVTYY